MLRDELDLTEPALRDQALGALLSLPEGHLAVLKCCPEYSRKARAAWSQIRALTTEAQSLPPAGARTDDQTMRSVAIDSQVEALRAPIRAEYQVLLALAHKAEAIPGVIDRLPDTAADALVEMLCVCPSEDRPIVLRALARFGPRAKRLLPTLRTTLDANTIPGAADALARIANE
jgi:hypothetical protein